MLAELSVFAWTDPERGQGVRTPLPRKTTSGYRFPVRSSVKYVDD